MTLNYEEYIELKHHCTFSVGGPARYFVTVTDLDALKEALNFARKNTLDFFILGKGSNILFDDRGYDGLVIQNKVAYLERKGTELDVGAGYSFSLLGVKTARAGLGGLEFASGIPGTVGGAVFMNAGANGSETCDALKTVTYLHENGIIETLDKKYLKFAYRSSSFQAMKGAIVSVRFSLLPSEVARKKQIDLVNYRIRTQPYSQASAGCTFKNLDGKAVGQLIEECGLKGLTVGGAQVSDLHGNFIINTGTATAQDVLALIQLIQKRVKVKENKDLSEEIRYIAYSNRVKSE